MKLVAVIGTAVLSLTLGAAAPSYAQQEQHDQQEEQKDKPEQNAKKAQPDKPATPEEKSAQQQDKNAKPGEKGAQQQERQPTQEAKPGQQAQGARGNGSGRIPDDRFKANFGREHTFRVTQGDYGNRRFQYGGYWFGFVGVWPSNWLYTQEVFVVDINGVYYLCNPTYPGVNIALSVTL
jgi:hypothetical protein